MWINFTDDEVDLLQEALRGLSSDRDGNSTTYDGLHDKIAKATADFDEDDPYRSFLKGEADDEMEVDEDAIVSLGSDPGAFVHAWIWVTDEEAGLFTCSECSGEFTLDRRHCSVDQICDECSRADDEPENSTKDDADD